MSGKAAHIRSLQDLSKRQRSVLEGISQGKTLGEIGDSLGLTVDSSGSSSGVEFHVAALYRRTHLTCKTDLVRLGIRLGVADTDP